MAEYITRYNATIAATNSIWEGKRSMSDVADAINKIPSEDVAPVRHGRWIYNEDGVFTCSECGNAESSESYFCRYCGSRMVLRKDEQTNIGKGEEQSK